jgi:hypothetical protein
MAPPAQVIAPAISDVAAVEADARGMRAPPIAGAIMELPEEAMAVAAIAAAVVAVEDAAEAGTSSDYL